MYGFLTGALALIVLQVVVSNENAYNAVGGIVGTVATAAQHLFDPNVPAIGARTTTSKGALSVDPGALTGVLYPQTNPTLAPPAALA